MKPRDVVQDWENLCGLRLVRVHASGIISQGGKPDGESLACGQYMGEYILPDMGFPFHPMSTSHPALKCYSRLIDELAEDTARNFGGIGDPLFEGVRFYTCNRVEGSFKHDRMTELVAEKVNEIEHLLMQAEEQEPLYAGILAKLKAIAPKFNLNGKFVFLASWGMGPEEIGWAIRHLNDRSMFEQYLAETGISEANVDLYNAAYGEELHGESAI